MLGEGKVEGLGPGRRTCLLGRLHMVPTIHTAEETGSETVMGQ